MISQMVSESFSYSCFVVVFRSFSENFSLGAPELAVTSGSVAKFLLFSQVKIIQSVKVLLC